MCIQSLNYAMLSHTGSDLRAVSLEVEEGVYPVSEVRHVGHDLRAVSLEVEEGVYPVPEVRHVVSHRS